MYQSLPRLFYKPSECICFAQDGMGPRSAHLIFPALLSKATKLDYVFLSQDAN